jgi:hypothetical protein
MDVKKPFEDAKRKHKWEMERQRESNRANLIGRSVSAGYMQPTTQAQPDVRYQDLGFSLATGQQQQSLQPLPIPGTDYGYIPSLDKTIKMATGEEARKLTAGERAKVNFLRDAVLGKQMGMTQNEIVSKMRQAGIEPSEFPEFMYMIQQYPNIPMGAGWPGALNRAIAKPFIDIKGVPSEDEIMSLGEKANKGDRRAYQQLMELQQSGVIEIEEDGTVSWGRNYRRR